MDVDDVTVSTLAADMDKQDAEKAERTKGVVDYSKVEADIEASKQLAQQGQLQQALDGLLNIEKQQRLAEDVTGTRLACTAVLDVLFSAKDWKQLNEHIILLSKRRSQLKQVVQAFVRQAMSYVDQMPDKETKVELIKTLQSVTDGKIHVEIERARLTKRLARIKEAEGNIDEAAEILQEVAVETFGAMDKREKIAFILEQVRLCLERQDFIRAVILIRKVSPRAFLVRPDKKGETAGEVGIEGTAIEAADEDTPSLAELKVTYYRLFIRYHQHNNNYLEAARCYKSIYESEGIAADPDKYLPVLRLICWFIVLAPASSDQVTLLELTAADRKLEALPLYKELLDTFITKEVVWWSSLAEKFAGELESQVEVFGGEGGQQRRDDFRLRITERNILVIHKYYSRIRLARLATLLDMSQAEAEKHLSEMVVAGALYAKIDRPAGVVRFAPPRTAAELLDGWAGNITKLLGLVEKATQQIQKESMIHRVPIGAQ